MAAPTYATDLTDITLAESTTGWSAYGGGASGLSASPDLSMQGTNCVDKQVSNADKGQYYDNGSGITLGTGAAGNTDHVFIWHFCGTPGLTDSLQNKGASVLVGTASNAYCQYHAEGNDTYGAAGRVARCYAVDYSVRSASGSAPYRSVTGSPGANPQVFGGGLNTTASVKGANCGIDAMRYGTGLFIIDGDGTTPATFAGAAAQNDSGSNRWGILTAVGGGYELQGELGIGMSSAGTKTACQFEDDNVTVSLVNTAHAASDFTRISFFNSSTVVNWTNVTIQALGTTNPGRLLMDAATTPTLTFVGCNFLGIGISTLTGNFDATNCTWRGSDKITLADTGPSLTSCTIADTTATDTAMAIKHLNQIDACHFVGSGSEYAVDLGVISSNTTMTWNCTFDASTYAATDGSTGSEVLTAAPATGVTLTVNVAAGASTPTVHNQGAGTITVVSGQVTTTITVVDVTTGSDIVGARVYLEAAAGGPLSEGTVIFNDLTDSNGEVTDTRSLASSQPVTGWVRKGTSTIYYQQANISATISNATGLTLTVQMIPDE